MIDNILLITPINAMPPTIQSCHPEDPEDGSFKEFIWSLTKRRERRGLLVLICWYVAGLDWMDTEKGSWSSHIWEDCCVEFSELDSNQPPTLSYHQRYSGETQTFLYTQASSVQLKGETPIRSLSRLTMKLPSLAQPSPTLVKKCWEWK